MEQLTPTQVLAALRSGNTQHILGSQESAQVEYKLSWYRLSDTSGKFELAKDISALANSEGGLVAIGFRTEKTPEVQDDQVVELCPIEREQFDVRQLHDVVRSWLYPQSIEVIPQMHPFEGGEKAFITLSVPKAALGSYPVLVRKYLDETGKLRGNGFAIFERAGSHTTSDSPDKMHALYRAGVGITDVRDELANVTALLSEIRDELSDLREAPSASQYKQVDDAEIENRIKQASVSSGLIDEPKLILYAHFGPQLKLDKLFGSRQTSVLVQLFERPPELRSGGFDLDLNGNSKIVLGSKRQIIVPEFGLAELYRDGFCCFVFGLAALTWGRKPRRENAFLLNQLSLIERTFLFCKLIEKIAESYGQRAQVKVGLRLRQVASPDYSVELANGPLGEFFPDYQVAPSPDFSASLDGLSPSEFKSEAAAATLLGRVYNWFGFPLDDLPYAQDSGERIDVEALQKPR